MSTNAKRPGQTAFGRARQATAERPVPLTVQTPVAPTTPLAPLAPLPSAGTRAPAREVAARFTVRIYDPAHVEAWQTLRHELSKTLGRMPSLSEVAEVAARALLDDEQARTRAGQLLPRKASS